MIQRNLSSLKENIRKKQLAQDMYYQGASNSRSPLIRGNAPTNVTTNNKPPVHNRLGRKMNQNQNQNQNQNKFKNNRKQNVNNSNNNTGFRQNKSPRVINLKKRVRLQRPNNNNNQGNFVQVPAQQKIILRKARPRMNNVNPMNYTVEVKNNVPAKHHTELNPRLQAEIKLIQRNSQIHEIVQPIPIHPVGSGTTKTTLNDRFSHL